MSAVARSARLRRGISLLDVAVVIFILIAIAVVFLPKLVGEGGSREIARGNTCRNNMRGLATALFNSSIRTGAYPGYMNVLKRTDRKAYVDPTTGTPTPISWAVMILPDIDRAALFDHWRRDPKEVVYVAPTGTGTGASSQAIQNPPRIYIEQFLCPTDVQPNKNGTPISFVVNTGIPDVRSALFDEDPTKSIPRDWAANGVFFDNFSEHELVKPDPAQRGPMVYMRDEMVRDPKSRTILLTENVDATSYLFEPAAHSANDWQAAELQVGCIWRPGALEGSAKPPTMKPPVASLAINVDVGKGDGKSYDYCRPSSRHPQSVNVAYVEQNVQSLRDNISYFVYAKMMASDDEGIAPAGRLRDTASQLSIDPHGFLRTYELSEEDINP